ncbi:MAG: DUF3540 domain-containing protein [Panacagrimonas sp.]
MIGIDAAAVTVRTAAGVIVTRKAVSCLLEPEAGDKVLVSGASASEGYVIAVLERSASTPQRLRLSGDTRLTVENGSLQLLSEQGIEMKAGSAVSIDAPRLEARARHAHLIFGELACIGRTWHAALDKLGFVGQAIEVVAERLSQRLTHSVREVEQVDQLRSGQIDYRASGNASLRGRNTLVTASELVKLDGDQIHLG